MLVIPAIDLIEGKCVRLYQGDYGKKTLYRKDPVDQAREFQAVGFQRLHVVDLEGARSGSGQNRRMICRIVEATELPVQVGGGVRSPEDVSELLGWGVRYLVLGTVALERPDLVSEWVAKWGSASFIISLDLRENRLQSQGWLRSSRVELDEALKRISDWDSDQVICTDVERDGTLEQPNYDTYEKLLAELPGKVKLIAAGGISRPQHLSKLKKMGVRGAVVGRALYEGPITWEKLINAG
jgi:phosphoribosylformimino-5-aminoimidazole carboxamide ribotide isomerase